MTEEVRPSYPKANVIKEKAEKLDEVIELLRIDSGVIMDDIHEWLIEVQEKYIWNEVAQSSPTSTRKDE